MRGVEVLLHGEAFLEVRDDRSLDDFAGRLGHQAAHTAQLLHLRLRSTSARVGHHPHRVDLGLATGGVLLDGGDFRHHLVGNAVGGLGPGINDLVVFLTFSDQAVRILLLVFLDQLAGGLDDALLAAWDDDVVLAEGDARLRRLAETQTHDRVGEDHRRLLAAVPIDYVDQVADFLLGQALVDQTMAHSWVMRQ